ncbi:hypothetical protein D1605_009660 [Xylella fastidiosa subsp. fastidiosa]|jgi:hypothetical protein|uniref:hypothetical protein n=1 Tax=Xylella fastidiosa TaxID=2371 RepID=UPI0001E35C02|nr:hypothetical protein [Xylella fastidiosa]ADN62671.1 hypothetical protein XFLM_03440 [Xylella fastidiosa subsp. fastidiosa GB514]KAF0571203.1 hypothetical protein P305_05985 [Xylella fastidiosa subsp. fastidiosa Mus-1]EGO82546.1 hypothetical protein XFEB_00623 [Xylella fastidiosa EB92.1]MBE0263028.1 hypothetical protein [Xylella fastidiosa subsp. fastidiosa]MBE0263428.1 hypothetical protein [Xylella fastidiosa subsp. fastidiosa]
MHNLPAALLAHLEQEATALHKLTERLMTACEATSTSAEDSQHYSGDSQHYSGIEQCDINRSCSMSG